VRFNEWTINGKSFPDTDQLIAQTESSDTHPLHLHRHTFEITNILGKLTGGVTKDVVLVNPFSTAEIDGT
jgi:FtsP/CotA-like multicopper oxidase with cupredoxin domain